MSKTQIPADWPQQNVDDRLLISDTPPGLNTIMPNGKKFGDCTGAEIGLIGQIMSEYRAERLAEEERKMGRDLDERYAEHHQSPDAQKLLELFADANGRPPETVEEFEAWLSAVCEFITAYDRTPDGEIIH
jgi:hypothetical protein